MYPESEELEHDVEEEGKKITLSQMLCRRIGLPAFAGASEPSRRALMSFAASCT
jgi:hypothetical protein